MDFFLSYLDLSADKPAIKQNHVKKIEIKKKKKKEEEDLTKLLSFRLVTSVRYCWHFSQSSDSPRLAKLGGGCFCLSELVHELAISKTRMVKYSFMVIDLARILQNLEIDSALFFLFQKKEMNYL